MTGSIWVKRVGSNTRKTISGIGAIPTLIDAGNASTIVSKEGVRTGLHTGISREEVRSDTRGAVACSGLASEAIRCA